MKKSISSLFIMCLLLSTQSSTARPPTSTHSRLYEPTPCEKITLGKNIVHSSISILKQKLAQVKREEAEKLLIAQEATEKRIALQTKLKICHDLYFHNKLDI